MSEDLIQRVLKTIAASKRIPRDSVTIDSQFEQLGIDSMYAVEILFALENEFDINIPNEEVQQVRNVRQMCEGVAKLVAAKSEGSKFSVSAPEFKAATDPQLSPASTAPAVTEVDTNLVTGPRRRLTVADLAVASPFVNLEHTGWRIDAARHPKTAAYVAAIHARPSFAPIITQERGFFAQAAA